MKVAGASRLAERQIGGAIPANARHSARLAPFREFCASSASFVDIEQFAALRRITTQITGGRDVREVLDTVTGALVDVADVALARIWLYVSDADCTTCLARDSELALHLAASSGLYTHTSGRHHRIELGRLKIGEIADTRRALCTNDAASDPRIPDKMWVREQRLVAFAGYPLLFRGELVGVLGMFSRHMWGPDEFASLEVFAAEAATAIKIAQLFSELGQLRDRLMIENDYLQEEIRTESGFEEMIGTSPPIRRVLEQIRQVGPTDSSVLLSGETGTGKELVARALHAVNARGARTMIRVNCGAIPSNLVESELFGHERGAFTGALSRHIGRFEMADRSTLFLDEVGELPLDAQVKLLRVVQERELERVGGTTPIRVDVRVVAATNRDLGADVEARRFRSDLFYRLNVFPIRLPPLRDRREDIPPLVGHFLRHFQRRLARPFRGVTRRSMDQLVRYSWPGNIRELQNVLERACILARGTVVDVMESIDPTSLGAGRSSPRDDLMTLEEAERSAIRRALEAAGGRISGPLGAAVLLDINPSTLRTRMAKLKMGKLAE